MKRLSIIFVVILVTATVLFYSSFADGRDIHHRRRYEDSSDSESNEARRHGRGGRHRDRRGQHIGRHELQASGSDESREGRGFWDDLGGLAKKAAVGAYDAAKSVDWKGVAQKAKNVGSAAYNEAKKNRRKRSYESAPLPVEQVISEYLDDQETPKTLYQKRSLRKFDTKAYLNPKNQL